jgi:Mrp family chromosome partitioning ATPase
MSARGTKAAASSGVRIFEDGVVRAPFPTPLVESVKDAHSVAGEEMRLLRARVQAWSQKANASCIALSSALPGEGKSTVAVGLATAFAREKGRRVLLVEADLRRPSISPLRRGSASGWRGLSTRSRCASLRTAPSRSSPPARPSLTSRKPSGRP